MAKYRKKPVVVEAVQFDPWGAHKMTLPEGVEGIPGGGADNWAYSGCQFFVTTKQGRRVEVQRGEWIIREADGSGYYPCHPDTFAATYEPITTDPIHGVDIP